MAIVKPVDDKVAGSPARQHAQPIARRCTARSALSWILPRSAQRAAQETTGFKITLPENE